jgi:tetratricopeptide (TPR) repeat protein
MNPWFAGYSTNRRIPIPVIVWFVIVFQLTVLHLSAQESQDLQSSSFSTQAGVEEPSSANTAAPDTETAVVYPERVRSWVLLEEAKRSAVDGEYGEALRVFREIEARGAYIPEVKLWQGYIYRAEGEFDLAERYYREALENNRSLYVSEDIFTIRYELAGLYEQRYMLREYEETLLTILESDETFSSENSDDLYEAMKRTLLDRGFQKWIELYRLRDAAVLEAHDRLARRYYASMQAVLAMPHAMSAFLTRVSILIDALIELDPEWEFTTIEGLLDDTVRWDHLLEYIERSGFFESLYVFGCVLHQAGIESGPEGPADADRYQARAGDAWNIINADGATASTVSDRLRKLANGQLIDPFYDPHIR